MRKNPFYRRGRAGLGFKELAHWQLSKRPMTATELSQIFGMEPEEVKRKIRNLFRIGPATVMEDLVDDETIFTLTATARRTVSKTNPAIHVSQRSPTGDDIKQKHIEAAARRRRLMAAGLYLPAEDNS